MIEQNGRSVKHAVVDHPIEELIARRFSPYAFADTPVSDEELRSLFEAARWSASSYNEQPWRYLLATKRDPAEFEKMLLCLVEANQAWARRAPVLAIGCVMRNLARSGKTNPVAIHDLGAASANLTIQATAMGLHVHQMVGILPERVHEIYHLPADALAVTGLAIGHARQGGEAKPGEAADELAKRDIAARVRRKVEEFVFGGEWNRKAESMKDERKSKR